MSIRRVDARFLASGPVRKVALVGADSGWRDGLGAAGVDVVDPARSAGDEADLVVTTPAGLRSALQAHPRELLIEGRADLRLLRAAGFLPRSFAALPHPSAAERFVPLDDHAATAYALRTWSPRSGRRSRLARAALRAAPGAVVARFPGIITLATRRPSIPHLVAAAGRHGAPSRARSYMATGPEAGAHLKRNVFFLFDHGSSRPSHVVKVARLRGHDAAFRLEEQGLAAARAAAEVVRDRAPAFTRRFALDDFHASVEPALAGRQLSALLLGSGRRSTKWAYIEAVARWLTDVSRATAAPAARRLATIPWVRDEMLEAWGPYGAPTDLWTRVRDVPAVFQHNDLWPDNVLVDGSGFRVVDWERARRYGLPLCDLVFLSIESAIMLDRRTHAEERVACALALLLGRHPDSSRVFALVTEAVRAGAVPPSAVGAIVTIGILERGYAPWSGAHDAPRGQRSWRAELAQRWLSEPSGGAGWTAFRPATAPNRSAPSDAP